MDYSGFREEILRLGDVADGENTLGVGTLGWLGYYALLEREFDVRVFCFAFYVLLQLQ